MRKDTDKLEEGDEQDGGKTSRGRRDGFERDGRELTEKAEEDETDVEQYNSEQGGR